MLDETIDSHNGDDGFISINAGGGDDDDDGDDGRRGDTWCGVSSPKIMRLERSNGDGFFLLTNVQLLTS